MNRANLNRLAIKLAFTGTHRGGLSFTDLNPSYTFNSGKKLLKVAIYEKNNRIMFFYDFKDGGGEITLS